MNFYKKEIEKANAKREEINNRLLHDLNKCLAVLNQAHKNIGDVYDYIDCYNPEIGMAWRKRT